MAMSKQHYEALARVFADARPLARDANGPAEAMHLLEHLATQMAAYMATENPQFDTARFLDACFPRSPRPGSRGSVRHVYGECRGCHETVMLVQGLTIPHSPLGKARLCEGSKSTPVLGSKRYRSGRTA